MGGGHSAWINDTGLQPLGCPQTVHPHLLTLYFPPKDTRTHTHTLPVAIALKSIFQLENKKLLIEI